MVITDFVGQLISLMVNKSIELELNKTVNKCLSCNSLQGFQWESHQGSMFNSKPTCVIASTKNKAKTSRNQPKKNRRI